MFNKTSHPTEQELFLIADGELSVYGAARVRIHLAACRYCRARMRNIEGKLVEFQQIYRQIFDPRLPSVAGPHAQLKARLAELATQPHARSWKRLLQFNSVTRTVGYFCMAVFVALVSGKYLLQSSILHGPNSAMIVSAPDTVPNRSLTPGVARQVAISDVCSMPHEQVVRAVPGSLRQKVLQEYGIVNARANDYEIDYLVTPGLGGVENIHNLWPEPYKAQKWNAHVKDALEEHLHQLVCSGKLDMPTAQRDIATNWISAYKKYFHTDKPLPLDSGNAHSLGVSFSPMTALAKLHFR